MTRYKHTELNDDDTSSVGAIQLTETHSNSGYHLRYHTSRATSRWRSRNKLEKSLLIASALMAITIVILLIVIAINSKDTTTRILHVQPHAKNQEDQTQKPQQKSDQLDESHQSEYTSTSPDQKNEVFLSNTLNSTPCLNKYCIFAASEILKSLDTSIDPCEDFYGFAW